MDLSNHRRIYVNKKLEFALFYDKKIKDKKKILNEFLESKDWKSFVNYFDFKLKDVTISKDLTEIFIDGNFKNT